MITTRSFGSTLDRMMTVNRTADHASAAGWPNETRAWVPAMDVIEGKEGYNVYIELPGVQESQVEVNFEQNVLAIRGVKNPSLNAGQLGECRVFSSERVAGAFERSIRLPDFIDASAITAEFAAGLLTVTIPKAKAAQPRRIDIKPSRARAAETAGAVRDN